MIYLAANNSGVYRLARMGWPVGMMFSPAGQRRPKHGIPYAIDNGLYHPFGSDPKPAAERGAVYGLLAKVSREAWPPLLFAVVPDMPYDAAETYRLLATHAPVMRNLFPTVPLALAVQDGMTPKVAVHVAKRAGCSWLFVAGSDAWKDATVGEWVDRGHAAGLSVHMARVNERRRLMLARDVGVDSADGTGMWRGDREQKGRILRELMQGLLFTQIVLSN
jgi:hypothetical protein